MTIIDILDSNDTVIKANIKILADDYSEKLNKKACLTCPTGARVMISELKLFYKMSQFEFLQPKAQYKNTQTSKTTISNSTMSDEKAVAFIKAGIKDKKKREKLFKTLPSNWKQMIEKGFDYESKDEKSKRLEVEAELKQVDSEEGEKKETSELLTIEKAREMFPGVEGDTVGEILKRLSGQWNKVIGPGHETTKKNDDKKDVEKMSLTELREAYPEIKATSIKDFILKLKEVEK